MPIMRMDERSRKPLRLPKYDYSQNGAYFVTICTDRRKHLLGTVRCPHQHIASVGVDAHIDPDDISVALSYAGRIVEKYIRSIPGIDAYVIMPNHVHMVVCISNADGPMRASAPTQPLSSRIRSFKTLVTKEIGQAIWQRSYYDHVIRDEADYLRVRHYIDTNPAAWAEDEYYTPQA